MVAAGGAVHTSTDPSRALDCGESDSRHQLADADADRASRCRVVLDHVGRQWTLFEHDLGAGYDPRTVLLAESGNVIRRFAVYPDDWDDMPDEALTLLIHAPVPQVPTVSSRLESRWGGTPHERMCDDLGEPED